MVYQAINPFVGTVSGPPPAVAQVDPTPPGLIIAPTGIASAEAFGSASVANASASTPLTIWPSNLLQWVRADFNTLNTGALDTLIDQSGAGKSYTHAAGTRATYTASDATLHNLPTFTTVVDSTRLLSTLVLPAPGTTPHCLLAILKATTPASNKQLFVRDGLTENYVRIGPAPDVSSINGSGATITLAGALTAWSRLRVDRSNQASDVLQRGAASTTGNVGNQNIGAAVGQAIGSTLTPVATIHEVIYLSKIPTGPEMAAYDAYVTARTAGAVAV